MFNLGYLPRGDRSIVTRAATTLAAIDGLLRQLSSGGRITILSYRGHSGGQEEYEEVKRYLDSATDVLVREIAGQLDSEIAPRLFLLEKKSDPIC
jgi:hypothetical protein